MLLSENQLAELTAKANKTIRLKLVDLPHTEGPKRSKLYPSEVALGVIYGVGADYTKGIITPAEAARRLTLARTAEIDLNMECMRKERIPLEIVEDHNEAILQNVAGIIKANEGKKLTADLIQELFAEFRRMDEVLSKYCRKVEPEAEGDPMFL